MNYFEVNHEDGVWTVELRSDFGTTISHSEWLIAALLRCWRWHRPKGRASTQRGTENV